MSKSGWELPEFKKTPKNQSKMTNFFSVLTKEQKWNQVKTNLVAIPESSSQKLKKPRVIRKEAKKSSSIDKGEAPKHTKRIVWSEDIKSLAINHFNSKGGTLRETIKHLQTQHPGSVFEALTISVLHSWVNSVKKQESPEMKSKKGRKTVLPEHLLCEMKGIVSQLLQSKTRVTTKSVLLKLTAYVQSKGYGSYLKVSFYLNK